jgi:hypothetical protein
MAVTKTTSGTPYVNTFAGDLYKDVNNGTDTPVYPFVGFPFDGTTYGYCWSGLSNGQQYYFRLGMGSAANNQYFNGSGTVTG